MLRRVRILLAVVMLLSVTALFLDFTGTLHAWLGWTARVQFLPAVMAVNVAVVLALVAVTLLAGRVYCSVVCPLGVMQDVVSWLSGRVSRKRRYRFSYTRGHSVVRYAVLALFVIAMVAGIGSAAALIAPYSAYGRIAANLLAPLWRLGNNVAAYFAERMDSYAFYEVDVWLRSAASLAVALLTLAVLGVLAWRKGRLYCNTVCPVGTVLGLLSRNALFRPSIDESRCVGCGLCARRCKASCIDPKAHTIDMSRCVACMDCIDECSHGAISLRRTRRAAAPEAAAAAQADTSRRNFLLTAAAMTAVAAHSRSKRVDGGLAVIEDKQAPRRSAPIVPAGALSARHFYQHCTACQLCVSVCPNDVLRPSDGIATLLQPMMSYERGYCRPECTRCSTVCPSGAIRPVTPELKSSTRIGYAVWLRDNCVIISDGVHCGNCARHCPSGAINMVSETAPDGSSRRIPVVNVERCIGCGACENLCPARPLSAIYVEGRSVHSTY